MAYVERMNKALYVKNWNVMMNLKSQRLVLIYIHILLHRIFQGVLARRVSIRFPLVGFIRPMSIQQVRIFGRNIATGQGSILHVFMYLNISEYLFKLPTKVG